MLRVAGVALDTLQTVKIMDIVIDALVPGETAFNEIGDAMAGHTILR